MPVYSLPWGPKPANTPCRELCSRGCRIYATRPADCRAYSCRWLIDESTAELPRPDKVGYVIDPMLDALVIEPHDGSPPMPVDCVQVWIDPARPEAHRDLALRRWLEMVADEYGLPALIRFDSEAGFILTAPSLSGGEWIEHRSSVMVSEAEMRDRQRELRRGR